jgi:murein DD-endopeptidase MepM/ murein hydrolase activator NlpD
LKEHTIIFVPHARAKFRKWRFTTLQASLLIGTLATLTLGGVIATILYFDTTFDRRQLDEIQQENAELRQVNKGFEKSIRDLGGKLEEYQRQIQKLAIVAGVSELSPTSDGGIGGPLSIESGLIPDGGEVLGGGGLDPGEAAAGVDPREGSLALLETWADDLGRDMTVLQERFDERRLRISRMPAITPVKGLLTSGFGYRTDPFTKGRTFHGGIDIVAPRGKEVRTTGDGFVLKTGVVAGLGNAVYVSHGYGITTRYGHLMKILVEEGQRVKRGGVVGLVGNTGRATGFHVHYEVQIDGRPMDPLGYILDSTSPD